MERMKQRTPPEDRMVNNENKTQPRPTGASSLLETRFSLLILVFITSLIGSALFPLTSSADPTAKTAKTKGYSAIKLSDTLYELRIDEGYIVKVLASIGPDGVLLVDVGSAENGKALSAALRKLGGGKPKIAVLSHSHVEHWSGLRTIGSKPLYIGHENLPKGLKSGYFLFMDLEDEILPLITIKDEISIHFNGEEIRIRSFAGAHDSSDLVVWFTRSKVAFVGALVTALKLPTVDTKGGDIRRYPEITRQVLEYLPDDVKLVPGHGEDATHDQGVEFLAMLKKTAALVQAEIAKGKDLKTMTKEDLLKEWIHWEVSYSDHGYWLKALYEGYSGAAAARKSLKTVHEPLYEAYKQKGSNAAVERYLELKAKHPKEYLFDDRSLVNISAILIGEKQYRDAIPFIELCLDEFPNGQYTALNYDLLSQAYRAVGDKKRAIAALEKLLELDPTNEDALKRLGKLKAKK